VGGGTFDVNLRVVDLAGANASVSEGVSAPPPPFSVPVGNIFNQSGHFGLSVPALLAAIGVGALAGVVAYSWKRRPADRALGSVSPGRGVDRRRRP